MIVKRLITNMSGSPRLWLLLFLASMMLFGFFEVVDDVFVDPMEGDYEAHQFDKAAASLLQQFRSTQLTQVATDLTALGSFSVLAVFATLGFAAILGRRDSLGFLHMSISLLGAAFLPVVLKSHFGRDRPDIVDHLVNVGDLSFPSGHSFGATAAYVTFAFFGARYIQRIRAEVFFYLFAAVVVMIVGMTRIYLGVHYASDVLAGICAGGAWAFFVATIFSVLYRRQEGLLASSLGPTTSGGAGSVS